MTEDLKASVQAILAAARDPSDPHPSPDELVSYHTRQLEEADHARVRAHLIRCAECARAVIDLASFPEVEPLDPEDRLTPADVTASWERFRERLPGKTRDGPRRSWLSFLAASPRLAWATAAVFLLATIGLTARVVLRGPEPRVNLAIAELVPEDDAVIRSTGGRKVTVPPSGVVLTLALADPRTFPQYEVEIRRDDATLWTSTELRPSELGLFTLEIPHGFLPEGRYRIVIHGWDEGERITLAIYGVQLVAE